MGRGISNWITIITITTKNNKNDNINSMWGSNNIDRFDTEENIYIYKRIMTGFLMLQMYRMQENGDDM